MAELADAPDLGSGAARRGGSSPPFRTNIPLLQIDLGGGIYKQIVYGPDGGKLAVLQNATTLLKAMLPLPGGATAVYDSTGFAYFRHPDWLGSSRLATHWDHTIYSKEA